jgi:hypothetical protein
MDDRSRNEERFDAAMQELYESWRREIRYPANRFRQMLATRGGVETAHRLLSNADVSAGFMRLAEADRLELTMEYLILQPDFASLFTFEERRVARQRLVDNGMPIDRLP